MTPEQEATIRQHVELCEWARCIGYVNAMLAAERAAVLEECAVRLEVRMANVIKANSRGSRVNQAASFAADMLQAEAAAIRDLGEKRE